MKRLRPKQILFIGLVMTGCGCAAVRPPTAEEAYYSHQAAHEYPAPNPYEISWWEWSGWFWPGWP